MAKSPDQTLLLHLSDEEVATAWSIIESTSKPAATRWWPRILSAALAAALALGVSQPGVLPAILDWVIQTLSLYP